MCSVAPMHLQPQETFTYIQSNIQQYTLLQKCKYAIKSNLKTVAEYVRYFCLYIYNLYTCVQGIQIEQTSLQCLVMLLFLESLQNWINTFKCFVDLLSYLGACRRTHHVRSRHKDLRNITTQ